jgi:tetratricopeptide (TPR) repeat protein
MEDILAQKAISNALNGNWEEAVNNNLQILKQSSKDIASLNRLARAYTELGQIKKAKATAEKVIKLDPINKIALRTLDKIKGLKDGESITSGPSSAKVFIEEPGKTKIVPLIHLGDPAVLSKLDAGDEVTLDVHCHRVQVFTNKNDYIGKIPDDISLRIKQLIKLENVFQAIIKSSDSKEVKVLVREVSKGKKAKNIISFPSEKIDYVSFASPKLFGKQNRPSFPNEEN